jgi:prepilin-type N-terminal cleavage/methylation domain-containing protein
MKTRAREAGFTLVEIAIVLVIIGLLLGGILKGQELITALGCATWRIRRLRSRLLTMVSWTGTTGFQATCQQLRCAGRSVTRSLGAGVGVRCLAAVLLPLEGTPISMPETGARLQLFGYTSRRRDFCRVAYPGNATQASYNQTTPEPFAPKNPWGGSLLLARTGEYLDALTGTIPPRLHLIIGRNIPVNVMRELDVKIDDSFPRSGVLRAPAAGAIAFSTVGQEGAPSCVGPDPGGGPNPIWDINSASADCNGYYLY